MKNTANYKKSKMVDERTINYRFSVKSKNDVAYQDLLKVIKSHNDEQNEVEAAGIRPHYLRVRGRGRGSYTFKGVTYQRSIPDEAADYFDVYVVRDTDAMARYELRAAKNKATGLKGKVLSAISRITSTENNTSGVTA